jgi:RNA polymerase sigma-70 factor, ECF subfamily
MGDPVTSLVREHFAFVWRVLRRLGLATADADDVAQRVMIIAAERVRDIVPGRERAFLFRIAWFLAAREKRDQSRRIDRSEIDADTAAGEQLDPEALLEQRRARARLDAVLRALSPDLRLAFVLFEIEGLTKHEVAEALDVPVGTAASRRRRAREEFRRQLQAIDERAAREGARA